jgi:hypothetical protein
MDAITYGLQGRVPSPIVESAKAKDAEGANLVNRQNQTKLSGKKDPAPPSSGKFRTGTPTV